MLVSRCFAISASYVLDGSCCQCVQGVLVAILVLQLRLAMYVILCECPDAMNLFAPDCGSWGLTARGASMRSELNPAGREALSWVSCNNCMVSRSIGCSYRLLAHKFHMVVPLHRISAIRSLRCVLLILLIMCKNGAWLLEQPQGSLLSKYSRWEWLCNRVAKALQTILCVCAYMYVLHMWSAE